MEHAIENMTLQEKVKRTELLIRELIEHLEMGFLPKIQNLQKASRVGRSQTALQEIADITIRTQVAQVLESEKFTEALYERLTALMGALEHDMTKVLYEGS
jgi:hypothetical protein